VVTTKPNRELTVYFRTDSHNISFGIEFVASHEYPHSTTEDIAKEIIHEHTRIDSHEATFTVRWLTQESKVHDFLAAVASIVVLQEKFVLEKVGRYEISWDNSFSRMRSKDLFYHFWIDNND
jgi:hypothetical protein